MVDNEAAPWARSALTEHLDALDDLEKAHSRSGYERALVEQMWPRTRAIFDAIDPTLSPQIDRSEEGWVWGLKTLLNHALGVVRYQVEVEQHLGPKGPRLDATGLHPWVWDSAAPLWGVGPQDAVNAAARAVNARIKSRVHSDLNDVALINQVFSDAAPQPGRPRLTLSGDRDQTWSSRTAGIRGLGQACFQGVRNVASHKHDAGWTEQEALEYLAMFSVLARWVEDCEVSSV